MAVATVRAWAEGLGVTPGDLPGAIRLLADATGQLQDSLHRIERAISDVRDRELEGVLARADSALGAAYFYLFEIHHQDQREVS